MPKFLVNQGEGQLLEIRHNDSAAVVNGLITLVVPPHIGDEQARHQYRRKLERILKEEDLHVGGIQLHQHAATGRWLATAMYIEDTFEHAQAAVALHRDLVADPKQLKLLTERERQNLPDDLLLARNGEGNAAAQPAQPPRTFPGESFKR